MSGPGQTPTDISDVVRDLMRRVTALEQASTARAGQWVLSTNADGDLIATSPSGNTVVLSDKPEQITVVEQVTTTTTTDDGGS